MYYTQQKTHLNLEIKQYIDLIDKCFKSIVVNQTMPSLHGGSIELTLTVPLMTVVTYLVNFFLFMLDKLYKPIIRMILPK